MAASQLTTKWSVSHTLTVLFLYMRSHSNCPLKTVSVTLCFFFSGLSSFETSVPARVQKLLQGFFSEGFAYLMIDPDTPPAELGRDESGLFGEGVPLTVPG